MRCFRTHFKAQRATNFSSRGVSDAGVVPTISKPHPSGCAIVKESRWHRIRGGKAPAEPPRRFISLGTVMVGLCCPILAAQEATPSTAREAIYENAKRHFAQAIFYKPEPNEDNLPSELAPLIVQEVAPDPQTHERAMKFGRLSLDQTNQIRIDVDDSTVYVDERSITIRSRTYTERVFALYLRPKNGSVDAGTMLSIHTVLDADGFPLATLVWDIGFQEPRRKCGFKVFVSQQLEDRAQSRFGDPLEGCRHSIEKTCSTNCDPVVPTVFPTGPIPMGPYVYLDDGGYVTTILCRCSPSQMDDVSNTHNYRVAPIEHVLALRDKLGAAERDRFPIPPSSELVARLLTEALRWPLDPPADDKPHENR